VSFIAQQWPLDYWFEKLELLADELSAQYPIAVPSAKTIADPVILKSWDLTWDSVTYPTAFTIGWDWGVIYDIVRTAGGNDFNAGVGWASYDSILGWTTNNGVVTPNGNTTSDGDIPGYGRGTSQFGAGLVSEKIALIAYTGGTGTDLQINRISGYHFMTKGRQYTVSPTP
jgi:hypothetical protein